MKQCDLYIHYSLVSQQIEHFISILSTEMQIKSLI